jgi:hypothetical protein
MMFSFRFVWDRIHEVIVLKIRFFWPAKKQGFTGARNPYAVYRAIHGADSLIPFQPLAVPDDHHVTSLPTPCIDPQKARELLNNLGSGDGSGLPYEKLFDPYYGSCLFCRKTIQKVHGHKHDKIFLKVEIKYKPKDGEESGSGHGSGKDNPQSDQLDGAPHFAGCVQDLDHWEPVLAPGDPRDPEDPASLCTDWLDPNTKDPGDPTGQRDILFPDTTHPSFDDPVQGPIPDCYLLAALSSVAWFAFNYPGKGQDIIAPEKTDPVEFTLYKDRTVIAYSVSGRSINPQGTPVYTNYLLPKKQTSEFTGAKTKTGNASWLPYYEKAYLRYLEEIGQLTPAGDPNLPDICRIPCGDPGETLRSIMGVPSSRLIRYIMNSKIPGYVSNNPDVVWIRLNNVVAERINCPPANISRRTQYPAVARTFCSSGPDITHDPEPDPCAAEATGVIYDNELIVASHSYSLLGIVHDDSDPVNRYVILRNPYGENPGFEYGMQYNVGWTLKYHLAGDVGPHPINPATGKKAIDYRLSFPSIEYNGNIYSIAPWVNVVTPQRTVVMPNDGKFAIRIDDFVRYFSEFAYVKV